MPEQQLLRSLKRHNSLYPSIYQLVSPTSSTSSMISGLSSAMSTTTGGVITVVPTIPPTSSPPVLPTRFHNLGTLRVWVSISVRRCEKSAFGRTTSSTASSSDPILNTDDTTEIIGLISIYQNALDIIANTCGAGFVQAAQGSHSSAIPTRRFGIGFGDAHETLGRKVWVTWFLVVAIFAAGW
ncbi:hypothetical protein K435DRAFT_876741 [Dendrothele bispora CBS 962.96]|uniref:Uncharacterized protein n=1 Tax=Dendrothele bispora (strain CBS 962.96) TaxID=1314807 RepID=A0A4S8KSG7_DENBC|nr:hypothetical protein K435DRAFT_876741 [Dendrothele bispora CBS 962.96]